MNNMGMRKVAFVYVYQRRDEEGYLNDWSLSHIVQDWTEVDEETFKNLVSFFQRAPSVVDNQERRLIMLHFDEAVVPRVISEVVEMAAEWKRTLEEQERKRLERQAARKKAKNDKELEEKRKLLEKLKKELGEQ